MVFSVRPETAHFRGASPEITAAIKDASKESGVSFSYLMTKAATESGFKADAKASTSSATGLYQFIESTWMSMVKEHGDKAGLGQYADALENGRVDGKTRKEILDLRKDPKTSAIMAAQYASDNKEHLEKTVGCKVGDTELYLAHFLGPAGAEKFLKAYHANPGRSAASVNPDAAGANRSIFYDRSGAPRSLSDVYNRFAAKFDGCETVAGAEAIPGAISGASAASSGSVTGVSAPGAITAAIRGPNILSPAAYAARIFMAGLSVPGERPGQVSSR